MTKHNDSSCPHCAKREFTVEEYIKLFEANPYLMYRGQCLSKSTMYYPGMVYHDDEDRYYLDIPHALQAIDEMLDG